MKGLFDIILKVSLLLLIALSFANCSNATAGNETPANTVMVVSERAYRSGTTMDYADCTDANLANAQNLDWNDARSGLVQEILGAIISGQLDATSFDWNTALGAAGTLVGDPLDFIKNQEAFLVYKVSFDPDSGVAIVEVGLHQGNPYDPNSQPVLTVSGTAIIGEVIELDDGETIQIFTPCTGIFFAARDAARQLIAQNFLDQVGPGQTPPSSGN